jgi:PhnB protein
MAVQPIPDGFHTLTPYIVASEATGLIEFLKRGLGAEVTHLSSYPDGKVMHAGLRIGDSMLMVTDALPTWPARPTGMYVYVPNVDEMYDRAMAAGATSINPPRNEFYGNRVGGVIDPSGNSWWFATHVEDVGDEELRRRQAAMLEGRTK